MHALTHSALRRSAVVALLVGLAACRSEPEQDPAANATNVAAPARPPLPVAEPPLDREALLIAAMRAASAHSAGIDDRETQRALDGKRFELRLRFGCEGPIIAGPATRGAARAREVATQQSGWTYNEERRRLSLRAVPDLTLDDPLARAVAGENVEAAEGFWLKRPWLLSAACPRGRPVVEQEEQESPSATAPAGRATQSMEPREDEAAVTAEYAPRIAIGQFFTEADSRTRRRDARPYETVQTIEEGVEVGRPVFDLVLTGRLSALPDGKVIACRSQATDGPPDCVISADIDQVRMERAGEGTVIAEWTD